MGQEQHLTSEFVHKNQTVSMFQSNKQHALLGVMPPIGLFPICGQTQSDADIRLQ